MTISDETEADVSAVEAVQEFLKAYGQFGDAVGWWSDAARFVPFRLGTDGKMKVPQDQPNLSGRQPFALRIFNRQADLNWENRPAVGIVCATQIKDEPAAGRVERNREYARLIWGSTIDAAGSGTGSGWATTFDGRVGPLDIPLSDAGERPAEGDRLAIYAVEYEMVDKYGNVSIVGERLTRIGLWPSPDGGQHHG